VKLRISGYGASRPFPHHAFVAAAPQQPEALN
jgi:hypothetical protein